VRVMSAAPRVQMPVTTIQVRSDGPGVVPRACRAWRYASGTATALAIPSPSAAPPPTSRPAPPASTGKTMNPGSGPPSSAVIHRSWDQIERSTAPPATRGHLPAAP